MLFRKKEYTAGKSLSAYAWRQFKRNRLAFSALWFIILVALIAILGYLITPDSSPMANSQHLELAKQKPGFSVMMLKVKGNREPAPRNIIEKMIYGKIPDHQYIPISGWKVENGIMQVTEYTPVEVKDKKIITFPVSDLAEDVPEENITKKTFILGTDRYGRDMLSRLMIGARVSLSVGFISVIISLLIGITLGAIAGFFRGWLDNLIVWIINVVWSIPTLLLVIAITFALGKGFWQVFIAVGLTMWVEVARVVRGQILSIREKEFVEAGKALGYKNFRIIFRHVLPNIMGPVIVISAANFAAAILIEAGLSFLGIGVQPPMPSWGTMIKENYAYIILDAAYLAILPGIAIMLMVLAFMIIGNGLRDALDVKSA
ncbi:MAG: ABC transporter permease [Bacteroidetes bacterium]|nr:ABC transporter permease [Bacteroidota bacterium]MCK5765408.1 ABC transporter permease [Bacteroidales bacterium]